MGVRSVKTKSGIKSAVVVGSGRPQNARLKLVLLAVVAVVFIGVLAFGIVALHHRTDTKTSGCPPTSDQALLRKAVASWQPTQVAQLGGIVTNIHAIKCYDKNPDYDLIATRYYINISSPTDAQTSLDALKKVYSTKTGYNNTLGPVAAEPAYLQTAISQLQSSLKDSIQTNYSSQP